MDTRVNTFVKSINRSFILGLFGISLILVACNRVSPEMQERVIQTSSQDIPTATLTVSPLSTPDRSLSVSPLALPKNTGGFIAFHTDQSGELQIHTIDLETSSEQQLVETGRSFEPSWSPDCQKIVFTSERNGPGNFELYLMNRDGSDQRKLIPSQVVTPGMKDWAPTWSPKGDTIAYQSNQNSDLQVCFASINGKHLGCHVPGWSTALPAWSPNGDQLLFIGLEDGDWDVFIVDVRVLEDQVELSEPVKLTDNTTVEKNPHMSPDGQYITFESNLQDNYDIMLMRADGTELRRLTSEAVDEVMPNWLGNEQVLYTRQTAAGWEIASVDVISGAIQTIKSTDALNKWPVWCGAE